MNLANKLTIFRIILVPIMVIIPFLGIQGEILGIPLTLLIVDLIFIIASLTDKLDGYIARSKDQVTTFGKFLDPLADKIFSIECYDNACGNGKNTWMDTNYCISERIYCIRI